MLITNFAAGELSENLFGRTDIPQYFQGLSRLENFDVIPTGGIKRRGGTRRLLELGEAGRLIPFNVDRQNHLLLYLTPGAIRVIKNGAVHQTFTSSADLPLYAAPDEIKAVQYAQNFDTMILAHEQYQPVMLKMENGGVQASVPRISIDTELAGPEGLNTTPYIERDETYDKHGYLLSPGNYPSCVTFCNGRLVFAGTRNDRQRIFVSRVNDIVNFTTYKKFLTEKREYVIIRGTVQQSTDTIRISNWQEPLQFTKAIDSYLVDNAAFFPPNTRILEIYGDTIRLSNASLVIPPMTDTEIAALAAWRTAANALDAGTDEDWPVYEVGEVKPHPYEFIDSPDFNLGTTCRIFPGVYRQRQRLNYVDRFLEITAAMAQTVSEMDDAAAAQYLRYNYLDPIWFDYQYFNLTGPPAYEFFNAYQAALLHIVSNIKTYMRYQINGETFYGTPDSIYQQTMAYYGRGVDIYIPFYTTEILVDRHPVPDDGFTFEIASDMNDAIRWLAMNKGIIVGTETAEWIIPPGVTALDARAEINSRYGSDHIQGTAVNDATCFFQTGKKALVEYYIPQQDNNFRANNMAALSPQLLGESPVVEFDFIRAPYTRLCVTREDGAVVTLLYERSTGTFAWGRITTRGGIVSVSALPGTDGNDDVYLAVERDGSHFLEVLTEASGVYLDSFREWDGNTDGYAGGALIYDETEGKTWPVTEAPAASTAERRRWIGYPYASRARSMPILANDRMKPNNIKTLLVRFLDSFMPRIQSLPNGATDTIPHKEPFSGVARVPFPGVWDTDVMFEFVHERPTRCAILAINAEVN
jgi:hypothetical protein